MTKSILETILNPSSLSVLFQPIFQIQGGVKHVDSVEALIRGPRGTNFNRADILFDYVRRKKAEAAVDQSCFMAICDAVTRLPADVRVNVNIHAATLGQSCGFVDFFRRCAKKRSLKLERFTIEIVEHAPSCDASQLTATITQLRELGIRIALDDVGLGQSNYRMMLDCDPEYFKLDGYFVRDLSRDPKRRGSCGVTGGARQDSRKHGGRGSGRFARGSVAVGRIRREPDASEPAVPRFASGRIAETGARGNFARH